MAHAKPTALSYLVRGKLLSAVRGIVATLNWVIDFCGNFGVKEGSLLELTNAKEGKPQLDISSEKLNEKIRTEVESVIQSKLGEIVQSAVGRISDELTISGGSQTYMTVDKQGLHFTIDVLWS